MPRTPQFRQLLLLGALGLTGVTGAVRVLPGSPLTPAPFTPAPAAVPMTEPTHWSSPTFELLVMIRTLLDVTRQDAQVLTPAAPALRPMLERLTRQATLSPAEASAAVHALERALNGPQRAQVRATRLKLEQRVNLQLSSSRLARGEGFPDAVTYRLAFLVPGGQATVAAVRRDAQLNPFLHGVPASTLRALLQNLR